jgi:methylmalonyl-CoA mutase N-terminal domain/subunit
VRAARDPAAADEALGALEAAAAGTENVLPRIRACVEARVTLGEISDALRRAWGEYRP